MNKKIIYNYYDGFVDFPNKYSLTLFFSGCNLSCPFCYNKHVNSDTPNFSINDILEKKHKIEICFGKHSIGIVFSGGEPTLQNNFEEIINTFVKSNPLSIHTNGIILPEHPNKFQSVILSLKTIDCGIPKNYIERFKNALYYYNSCELKQINIVKINKYMNEYMEYLDILKEDVDNNGFDIKFIEYYKI